MILNRLFGGPARPSIAETLYASIVAQARQPALYVDGGVPDTLEGRFEMIILHASLVMRRLRDGSRTERDLAQEVFDTMFVDMDRSLREIGVGDMSVGKKVRAMAEAFYGRAGAYDAALKAADDAMRNERMAAALARNVFGTDAPDASSRRLARYAVAADHSLAAAGSDALLAGETAFPTLPEALLGGAVSDDRES